MPRVAKESVKRARSLRSEPTDAERRLWQRLRRLQIDGWHFRRQHPVPPYVLDFACLSARIAIEADGGQHSESARDEGRTRFLEAQGWRVLRFWNTEILKNTDGVIEVVMAALGPHPNPPPPSAGEGVDLSRRRGHQTEKGGGTQ